MYSTSASSRKDELFPYGHDIDKLLQDSLEAADDIIKSSVGECIGRLFLIDPNGSVALLNRYLEANNAGSKSVGLIAVRTALHGHSVNILKALIKTFVLELMKDSELASYYPPFPVL